ncbi:unnamed protein product [Closterium sp. Naga37s-1]|nr:unnamed protein product [Closterium sp. Naga37s-1]
MPLPIRVEATGGKTCQVAGEGKTSGRSTASAGSASSAEWSPPRGARPAREVRGGIARRPAGAAAEERGRSGASSEDEARSDDERRLSEHSTAHAANTAAPAPSSRHARRSSPSRAHSAATDADGAATPVAAPPLPHAHSASSPRGSSGESRWWKHGGPSGGGWGLGRSWSSSAVSHPRAEVNGGVGDNAPSGAGSGGGGKVWWFGYRRGISADYDIGDLVGRGRTGEVRRATARKGARKGLREKAEERGPPVVVKTICKAELATEESREAVRREVAIQRMLPAHAHVAALVDAYEDRRNIYLVLQSVPPSRARAPLPLLACPYPRCSRTAPFTRDSQPAASLSDAQRCCRFTLLPRLPCNAMCAVRSSSSLTACIPLPLQTLPAVGHSIRPPIRPSPPCAHARERRVGHAGEAAARHVVWQVLLALAHCHAHLVVHRDIKPENVLLAKSSSAHDPPHVKLIDFGLAALLPPLPLSACPAPTNAAAACPTTAHSATAPASSAPHAQQQQQQHHQHHQAQPNSSLPIPPPAPVPASPAEGPLCSLPPVCVPLPQLHEPLSELLGSQDYLSPDVLRAKYGTPSDLFSLASLAYLLLCGRLPFSPSPRCLRTTMHAVATQQAGFTESAWGDAGEAGMGVGVGEGVRAGVARGPCVSGEGRHAVQSLMAKDAARRPTAAMMLCHPWFHDLHTPATRHVPTPPASASGTVPASPAMPLDPCVPLCLLHVLALPAPHKHHLQSQAMRVYKDQAWVRVYAAVQCRHVVGVWPGDSMHVEQEGGGVSVSLSHVHKVLSLCACKSLADSFLNQVVHHSSASALHLSCSPHKPPTLHCALLLPLASPLSLCYASYAMSRLSHSAHCLPPPVMCCVFRPISVLRAWLCSAMPSSYPLPATTRPPSSSAAEPPFARDRAAGAPGPAEPGSRGREVAQRGEQQRAEGEREATFEERVARSILVDELCAAVTPAALQSALGQFGTVRSVQMVPNLLHPRRSSGCAIVELHSRHLALKMMADISESILIVGAGPRPVRAFKARADMFDGAFVFPSALHAAALPQSAPAVTSAAGAQSSPLSAASALPGFRVTDAAGEGAAGGGAGGGSGDGGGAGQGRWRWRLTVMEERQRGGGGGGGGEGAGKKAGGGEGGGERGVGTVEWQRARRWKEVAGRQAEEMKMLMEVRRGGRRDDEAR